METCVFTKENGSKVDHHAREKVTFDAWLVAYSVPIVQAPRSPAEKRPPRSRLRKKIYKSEQPDQKLVDNTHSRMILNVDWVCDTKPKQQSAQSWRRTLHIFEWF
jgi:hypothetical protein